MTILETQSLLQTNEKLRAAEIASMCTEIEKSILIFADRCKSIETKNAVTVHGEKIAIEALFALLKKFQAQTNTVAAVFRQRKSATVEDIQDLTEFQSLIKNITAFPLFLECKETQEEKQKQPEIYAEKINEFLKKINEQQAKITTLVTLAAADKSKTRDICKYLGGVALMLLAVAGVVATLACIGVTIALFVTALYPAPVVAGLIGTFTCILVGGVGAIMCSFPGASGLALFNNSKVQLTKSGFSFFDPELKNAREPANQQEIEETNALYETVITRVKELA